MRFDFYGVGFAGRVVIEAAPAIVFGFGDQAAGDWIAVDVLSLFAQLFWDRYVEVVITGLPELLLLG